MFKKFIAAIPVLLCIACAPLTPKREMRGVWVASVVNIDWPKQASASLETKKADFLKMLDDYQSRNFNTVLVQVRAAGDALYPTKLAPWSRFLTGKEGQAEAGYESLLPWMIEQTHLRGMEFHAWMNPYRATFDLKTEILSPDHDYFRHPDWMITYGPKRYYNPGLPEVQDHLTAITAEVVRKYDVDAIHFDDYFYPYKIKDTEFKDLESFKKYNPKGLTLEDWRRANVDSLIAKVSRAIRAEKPWVQFGISPFGVWRNSDKDPAGSPTRAGQTTYDDLYADPLLWMEKGWVDYMVPQLYWSLDHKLASHRKLLQWWSGKKQASHLYIGNGAYKVNQDSDSAWHKPNELKEQIALARATPEIAGNMYFSAKSFDDPKNSSAAQLQELYRYKALTPAFPGVLAKPEAPVVRAAHQDAEQLTLTLETQPDTHPRFLALYSAGKNGKEGKAHQLITTLAVETVDNLWMVRIPNKLLNGKKSIACSILNTYGSESSLSKVSIPQKVQPKS